MANALIKDHASTGVAAKILQDFRNQAAAYQSSAKGESLSRFDMACGLGLATPDVERAVGQADTIRIVGALWMIRFKA